MELPQLGGYRVLTSPDGSLVLGFPLSDVDSTVHTLVAVEVFVTLAGLIAASLAGQALVGVALRPLHRVAATATRVSELPCTAANPPCTNAFPTRRPTPAPRWGRSARP